MTHANLHNFYKHVHTNFYFLTFTNDKSIKNGMIFIAWTVLYQRIKDMYTFVYTSGTSVEGPIS